jgi:hypothetical protein
VIHIHRQNTQNFRQQNQHASLACTRIHHCGGILDILRWWPSRLHLLPTIRHNELPSEVRIFLLDDSLRKQPSPSRPSNLLQHNRRRTRRMIDHLLPLHTFCSSVLRRCPSILPWLWYNSPIDIKTRGQELEDCEDDSAGEASNETGCSEEDVQCLHTF